MLVSYFHSDGASPSALNARVCKLLFIIFTDVRYNKLTNLLNSENCQEKHLRLIKFTFFEAARLKGQLELLL